jgi:ubiquinone/menaquinone biosynthesis C-methylase UbiE
MNTSLLKKELQHCYSSQAEHFWHTRKKNRPEIEHIEAYLHKHTTANAPITILELWCGAWRLANILLDIYGDQLTYIWTDLAPWMIEESVRIHQGNVIEHVETAHHWFHWMVGDMLQILVDTPDNSVDVVISIASLQHLMTKEERQLVWLHMYRILRYKWLIMSTNRSYSSWFLNKYRKQQLASLAQICIPPRKRMWNDILIPRKDPQRKENNQIRRRYYHIFTIYELQQFTRLSGFVIESLTYVLQDGTLSETSRKNSRNTLLIAKKSINV